MDHGNEGMAELGEALGLDRGGVNQADTVHFLRFFFEKRTVTIHPDLNILFDKAFGELFDQGLVAAIDVGVALAPEDADFQLFSFIAHLQKI
jgi:hypothetical protein